MLIKGIEATQSILDRFWDKVNKNGEWHEELNSCCWQWTASDNGHGYGHFYLGGGRNDKRSEYSHRISYILYKGEIPDGLEIDHLCRNRRCVNPDHLEAVTSKINCLRGDSLSAQRARQKVCKRGHPLSGDNLYEAGGRRMCRTCREENRLANRERDAKSRRRRYSELHPIKLNNKGERNGMAKLTEEKVRQIKLLYKNKEVTMFTELGRMFGVADSTICEIIHGKRWQHVVVEESL
jgi:hypothetical protein